ncbi:hypothetical protein DVS77_18470 [Mycolicibacterium moriokaense]|nr:hypothetical protein DVS77_18470 [Mycolicibacterium moriokaense]
MAYFGQDVEQVRQLAGQLNTRADDIARLISQLSSTVDSVDWRGPDAERFRSEWQGQHRTALNAVVSALHDASQSARRNAQDQQTASGR